MDPRITPYRKDLAADFLEGQVDAARFVPGTRIQVCEPVADIRRAPVPDAALDSQALLGEYFKAYEISGEGWAWGQLETEGYVGYVPTSALTNNIKEPTHKICARTSFTYPIPGIKSQPVQHIPFGAAVVVEQSEGEFSRLTDGRFIWNRHICDIGTYDTDFVAVCEAMTGTPYLWGGTSAWGFDCSGLIYTGLKAAGIKAPRDSDMLEAGFGEDLGAFGNQTFQRGDLIFWKGHIGVMTDEETLLHANGYHMSVVSEPLSEAVTRIAYLYAMPTSCRRPHTLSRCI